MTTRTRLAFGVMLALAVTIAATGRGVDEVPSAVHDAAVHADDGVLYVNGSGDFPAEATPADVARRADYVIEGIVDGFEDGHTESVMNELGDVEQDRYVVIRVKIAEVLKGDRSAFAGGFAYVTRSRGIQTYDARGTLMPGRDVTVGLDDIERAIPRGSRILVMAGPATRAGGEVRNARAGVPEPDVPILDVENPQAILLDGGPESTLRGWQDDSEITFESALADVRALP